PPDESRTLRRRRRSLHLPKYISLESPLRNRRRLMPRRPMASHPPPRSRTHRSTDDRPPRRANGGPGHADGGEQAIEGVGGELIALILSPNVRCEAGMSRFNA